MIYFTVARAFEKWMGGGKKILPESAIDNVL